MAKRGNKIGGVAQRSVASYVESGSIPLAGRREAYCQERALFNSPTVAATNAGYIGSSRQMAANLERNASVRARIAYLSRDNEASLKRKRERLETFLWDGLGVDRSEFYETVSVTQTDRNGNTILDKDGKPKLRVFTQLKSLDQLSPAHRMLIESIAYTESGKPNLKLVSKEFAHRELRRMLGGDAEQAIDKAAEFSGYSDTELLNELSRMANDLGIKMTLSIEPSDLEDVPKQSGLDIEGD